VVTVTIENRGRNKRVSVIGFFDDVKSSPAKKETDKPKNYDGQDCIAAH